MSHNCFTLKTYIVILITAVCFVHQKVLPVPAYPVIQGCNHEQYCVLEVQREGSLTCTLTGIRPPVQLDVTAGFHLSPNVIEFFDKHLVSYDNGGAFDVSLVFKYRVKETEIHRVTVECRVVGAETDLFPLSTKFDMFFMTGNQKKYRHLEDKTG
ncbi:hypothetical protein HOLleu_03581 [Holothuria leucospilota]|uniref:Uncharacterized protein n=1 Tax=Holothuria leucospilota TaxID=206669 RepID=A0A9Q1CT08_HOLLE|nr:hypothetical protein HOLleu_03581 [Holothuria leucospilota]